VHDVDDLLRGRERSEHFGAERLLLHPRRELAHDLEVDVRFEHRHAHFAKRLVEVLFGHHAPGAELLEGGLQLVGQGFEHRFPV
jgi:hypothetical protein